MKITQLFTFLILLSWISIPPTYAKNIKSKTYQTYQNCSDQLANHLIDLLEYEYHFKPKEKDCLIIDHQQAVVALALPIEQTEKDTPYLLRIYLIDYTNSKVLSTLQKDESLYSSYEDFDGIHFDLVHFSTLEQQHVIGLRHQWSKYHAQTNSTNEYLELIHLQKNQTLHFVVNDLPIKSTYFSRGECPQNKAKWGASIQSIVILKNTQSHGLQDILLKQTYTHHEAHQDSGCTATQHRQNFELTIPFDGQKYQFSTDDLMQIDAI